MKRGWANNGFTLIEMLVVIAIILILIAIMAGVAKRIDDQGKERLCRGTIELIGNALEQFRDFGYEYKDADYAGLAFPLDCNNLNITNPDSHLSLRETLRNAIDSSIDIVAGAGAYDPDFSGSEALYFILSQVPDCRATLDKIDKSLLTNKGTDGTPINIVIDTLPKPFLRIIDPWGTTLRYDYYPDFKDYSGTWTAYIKDRDSAKLTFPVITSAGADKEFDTKDDVSNRQPK